MEEGKYRYDEKLISRLWLKHSQKVGDSYKSDRSKIIKDYHEATGIVIPGGTLSDYIKRIDKSTLRVGERIEPIVETKPKTTVDINQDGTQKLLAYAKMTSEQSKSPRYVMEINGYPFDKWEMVNLRVNEWGSITDPDNQYYQIRLTVKPKTIDSFTIDDIYELIKTKREPLKPIKVLEKKTDKSYALFITDKHIGSNLENDRLFKEVIERARADAIKNDVEHIYLYNLGDFLHVDNVAEQTNKGTQLKTESTAYRMWDSALELMSYAIERLSFVRLTFTWTQGNHSRLAEYSVMNALKRDYSQSPHITFDVDERYQKANLIYETFIGVFHGDMPKKNYTNWSQFQYSELWGKARYWEQYSGHYHSKEVFSVGGLEHTILGTMKRTDNYEQSLGYGNYRPVVEGFIYEKGRGKTIVYRY